MNEMIPLKMVVMEMAHQTPVTPIRAPSTRANGMRSVLNRMLIMAGRWFAKPLNMPAWSALTS